MSLQCERITIDGDTWYGIKEQIDKFFSSGPCQYCLDGVKHDECKYVRNDTRLSLGEFIDIVLKEYDELQKNKS